MIDYTLTNRVNKLEKVLKYVYCQVKNDEGGGEEIDPVFTQSPAYNIKQSDIDTWNSPPSFTEVDTLATVMNRDNKAPKEIEFHADGKLGYHSPTASYYFTNGRSATGTGIRNIGIGLSALSKNTTGKENIGIGTFALENLTTGQRNIVIGQNAAPLQTAGNSNIAIGYSSYYTATTGTENVVIGANAGVYLKSGNANTFLGGAAGFTFGRVTAGGCNNNTLVGYGAGSTSHAMGTYGDNNVCIGSYAPLGGNIFNTLVIDSYTTRQRHDLVFPLIGGHFVNRTLDFDASLKVRRLPDATADNTYTRQLVQKVDGTIGFTPKPVTPVARPQNHALGSSTTINEFTATMVLFAALANISDYTITIDITGNTQDPYYIAAIGGTIGGINHPLIIPISGKTMTVLLKNGVNVAVSTSTPYRITTGSRFLVTQNSNNTNSIRVIEM